MLGWNSKHLLPDRSDFPPLVAMPPLLRGTALRDLYFVSGGLRNDAALMANYAHAMSDITQILSRIDQGDPKATSELLPLVYDELRKLAAEKMAVEQPGLTLQATALVHEAYLRLIEGSEAQPWNSRGHFFAAAAQAMRRILVDAARRRRSLKGGGLCERIALSDLAQSAATDPLDLIALDQALQKLEQVNPRKAELVKLRYFAGLTLEQAAETLGVALSTASADWVYAKSWLCLEMRSSD